ncbi:hypothetical protein HDU67_002940, partial [Dinochytrium kinnereticum]
MSSNLRKPKVVPRAIKPIKKAVEHQFVDAWEILSTAIKEIYKKNASKLSFEELYRNAYNIVLNKKGDQLYNGVHNVIQEHLESVTSTSIAPTFPIRPDGSQDGSSTAGNRSMVSAGGQRYLKELQSVWEDHTTCMQMIRDVLLYVDRVFVKPANKLPIYDLGLNIFRDAVFFSTAHPVKDRTIETILDQIRIERDGEIIDKHAVKGVIRMLLTLEQSSGQGGVGSMVKSLYELHFEPAFLEASRTFYTLESSDLLSKYDATQYLIQAERRLKEEDDRVNGYLSPLSSRKLCAIVEDVLLFNHVKTICEMENSGLVPMLVNEKMDDLARMYRLLGRVSNGHEEMRAVISAYIKEVGRGINEQLGGVAQKGSLVPKGVQQNALEKSGSSQSLPSNPNPLRRSAGSSADLTAVDDGKGGEAAATGTAGTAAAVP